MKKGQTTIFIIVGIIIVAVILLFLFLRGGIVPDQSGKPEENPEAFIDNCLKEKVYEAIDLILRHGGYIDPLPNGPDSYVAINFTDNPEVIENISYLCYINEGIYNEPCISQNWMLIKNIKEEIQYYIAEDVDICFDELMYNLEDQGYTVEVKRQRGQENSYGIYIPRGFNVSLEGKKVVVNIDAEVTLTKSGETSREQGFQVIAPSRIHELIMLPVQSILIRETYCPTSEFSLVDFKEIHHEFDTKRIRTGHGNEIEIYTVEHEDTKEKFMFAVRSCVTASGYVGS